MPKKFLEAGKIVGTHGVRGDLKVQSWCDSPEVLCDFDTLYLDEKTPVTVEKAQVHKNVVLMHIKGIDTVEAAEAMLTGSLFAGIAFSYARLGNVHAMSHPVSAFFNVAHGVANAVLLPVIAEYNALADHGRYLKIYNYISPIPAYEDEFEPLMLVDAIRELNEDIGIPEDLTTAIRQAKKGEKLSDEEIESKIDAMADDAMKSGNIAVNPRSSRKQDIVELYHKAL